MILRCWRVLVCGRSSQICQTWVRAGKAPEGWSSPRRGALALAQNLARSVVDCGSPLPLSKATG
jgi:hypothetical protein